MIVSHYRICDKYATPVGDVLYWVYGSIAKHIDYMEDLENSHRGIFDPSTGFETVKELFEQSFPEIGEDWILAMERAEDLKFIGHVAHMSNPSQYGCRNSLVQILRDHSVEEANERRELRNKLLAAIAEDKSQVIVIGSTQILVPNKNNGPISMSCRVRGMSGTFFVDDPVTLPAEMYPISRRLVDPVPFFEPPAKYYSTNFRKKRRV